MFVRSRLRQINLVIRKAISERLTHLDCFSPNIPPRKQRILSELLLVSRLLRNDWNTVIPFVFFTMYSHSILWNTRLSCRKNNESRYPTSLSKARRLTKASMLFKNYNKREKSIIRVKLIYFYPTFATWRFHLFLKGECHEDFAVLGQFCTKMLL